MKAGKTSCQVDQPKPEMERPTVWGEPTEVQVAIYIIGQQMAWRSVPESVEIRPEGTVISRQKEWGRFFAAVDLPECSDTETISAVRYAGPPK